MWKYESPTSEYMAEYLDTLVYALCTIEYSDCCTNALTHMYIALQMSKKHLLLLLSRTEALHVCNTYNTYYDIMPDRYIIHTTIPKTNIAGCIIFLVSDSYLEFSMNPSTHTHSKHTGNTDIQLRRYIIAYNVLLQHIGMQAAG